MLVGFLLADRFYRLKRLEERRKSLIRSSNGIAAKLNCWWEDDEQEDEDAAEV